MTIVEIASLLSTFDKSDLNALSNLLYALSNCLWPTALIIAMLTYRKRLLDK